MIYDWGVHLIDQILFMMPDAKIKSVYADIKNVLHEEVDDYFKIILKMDNGVTAHIESIPCFTSSSIEASTIPPLSKLNGRSKGKSSVSHNDVQPTPPYQRPRL